MSVDVKRSRTTAARKSDKVSQSPTVDPRCIPQELVAPPPVGDEIDVPAYGSTDHETWRLLFERQMQMLPGRADDAFVDGVEMLGLAPERIPALPELSRRLQQATGWRVARVPGLLHERDFFMLLAQRVFPSTDYVRRRDELDYTPAPDCFHDIFGHMPMLTQPEFADFYCLFGRAALNARGADRKRLERLHWFTVEFGLIEKEDERRVFGAGILSSGEEVKHALSDDVTVHPFDPWTIVEKDYDVWHLQDELFALSSFEELVAGFSYWARRRGLVAF